MCILLNISVIAFDFPPSLSCICFASMRYNIIWAYVTGDIVSMIPFSCLILFYTAFVLQQNIIIIMIFFAFVLLNEILFFMRREPVAFKSNDSFPLRNSPFTIKKILVFQQFLSVFVLLFIATYSSFRPHSVSIFITLACSAIIFADNQKLNDSS